MKMLYLIGGTMGVGKTTVCQRLKRNLPNSVFLDGDWCWDAHPFQVNEETKTMVLQNICFLLNQFLHCSVYQNIVFCWVMHEQSIIDIILQNIDTAACEVKAISLLCSENTLRSRWEGDVLQGIRMQDGIERSVSRLPLYNVLNTEKIDTDGLSIEQIAQSIMQL